MLPSFKKTPVTIRRSPLVEMRGSLVRDWDNFEEHTEWVLMQPTSTSSNEERAENVTDRWQLLAEPHADIQRGDRVVYGRTIYEIDGDPYLWTSPTGRVSNLQCHLIAWSG